MEIWPESALPKPSVNFTGKAQGNTIRSKMDSGLIRQRRRFSVELNTYSVTWNLTEDERTVFRKFFRDKINHGGDSFTIELPVGDGNTFTPLEARFSSGGFSESYQDFQYWTISASLECPEVAVISDDLYYVRVEIGDLTTFYQAVDAVETAANTYADAVDAVINP